MVHDEADRPRACGHQQHRVDECDVVAHQDGRALGRDVLVAAHLEAVDEARDHERDEAQQILRHQHEDVKRDHSVQQTRDQEHLRDRDLRRQQRADTDRADDHEQRIQDVVRRDDAGAVAGLRAHLNERVHRHAVEPREQRKQRQVGHHAPVRGLRDELGEAEARRWRQAI